ncbi:SpoIIE family protein phosphatase [Streptomyces populi]
MFCGRAVGATCLYAMYAPVSRRRSVARGGHPPPVVTAPDARVAPSTCPPAHRSARAGCRAAEAAICRCRNSPVCGKPCSSTGRPPGARPRSRPTRSPSWRGSAGHDPPLHTDWSVTFRWGG